jgi:hypothetical protein
VIPNSRRGRSNLIFGDFSFRKLLGLKKDEPAPPSTSGKPPSVPFRPPFSGDTFLSRPRKPFLSEFDEQVREICLPHNFELPWSHLQRIAEVLQETPLENRVEHARALFASAGQPQRTLAELAANAENSMQAFVYQATFATLGALESFVGRQTKPYRKVKRELLEFIQNTELTDAQRARGWKEISPRQRIDAHYVLVGDPLRASRVSDRCAPIDLNPEYRTPKGTVGIQRVVQLVWAAIENYPVEALELPEGATKEEIAQALTDEQDRLKRDLTEQLADCVERGSRMCIQGLASRLTQPLEWHMGTGPFGAETRWKGLPEPKVTGASCDVSRSEQHLTDPETLAAVAKANAERAAKAKDAPPQT